MQGVHQTLIEAENSIRFNSFETGMIFNTNGEKLWEKKGDRHSVDVYEPIMKRMLKGNIFTHNHPFGGSFSFNDFKVFLAHGLAEMRAVDSRFSYSMSFSSEPDKADKGFLLGEFERIDKEMEKEYQEAIKVNIDTDLFEDYYHELFTRLSLRIKGFLYVRTPNN